MTTIHARNMHRSPLLARKVDVHTLLTETRIIHQNWQWRWCTLPRTCPQYP